MWDDSHDFRLSCPLLSLHIRTYRAIPSRCDNFPIHHLAIHLIVIQSFVQSCFPWSLTAAFLTCLTHRLLFFLTLAVSCCKLRTVGCRHFSTYLLWIFLGLQFVFPSFKNVSNKNPLLTTLLSNLSCHCYRNQVKNIEIQKHWFGD